METQNGHPIHKLRCGLYNTNLPAEFSITVSQMDINISVEDFGPIGRCHDIELKPLTVFLGPSNSGKSYFATMAYGFANAVQELLPYYPFGLRRRPSPRRPHRTIGWEYPADKPVDEVVDQLRDWASRIYHGRDVDWQDLPEPCRLIINSQVERKIDSLNELLNDEFAANSHGTVSDLVRRNSESKLLKVRLEVFLRPTASVY